MTLRDLYNLTAAARGHWVLCGTPQRIADTLEEWFIERAADGFNILPAAPGAFSDFVDRVVPELQRRGLFRREDQGTTLRDISGWPAWVRRWCMSAWPVPHDRRAQRGSSIEAAALTR